MRRWLVLGTIGFAALAAGCATAPVDNKADATSAAQEASSAGERAGSGGNQQVE